ncbi:class I SAM-dependent methyltransferase [Cohnella fermenti]|uniref:class I SAM-dependent methyltransferase n=1 Tax=Cohnella fermenti TaxID=2565925 RepID=UPI001454C364|nr:class I SAM-dependent methyltransferase [Cohnella fermenti]
MKYDYDINLQADSSLSHILRRIKPNSKVLEFGPAKGYMTQILADQLHCSVYCVELDEEAAKHAAVFSKQMIVGDLDAMRWATELQDSAPFDYIIFADVLEHLKYPDKVLIAATSMLDTEGVLFTSIPNMAHSAVLLDLLQGNYTYRRLGLLDNTHLRFYTKKSIKELLENSGLSPIEWVTTKMMPEQTELETNYEYVPEYIANYIRDREEAHVYQYITVSRKSSESAVTPTSTSGKWGYSRYMQLFWGSPYLEQQSIKLSIDSMRGNKIYRAHLPQEAAGQNIRIDPTNFPAFIEVKSMILLDLQNNVLHEWSEEDLQASLHAVHQLRQVHYSKSRHSLWVADGDDPHWELYLPQVSVEDLILEVHMHSTALDSTIVRNIISILEERKQQDERIKAVESEREQLLIELQDFKLKVLALLNSRFWKWTQWFRPKTRKLFSKEVDQE